MKKITGEDLQLMDSFRSLDMDNTLVVKFKKDEKGHNLPIVDFAYRLSDIIEEIEKK